jgi:hypothetical protein
MNQRLLQTPDTIWKFHLNPSDAKLFIECKKDSNEFYLWDADTEEKWTFPYLEKHASTILQVQYPYVLLSYMHTENLMNQVVLMCYDLEQRQEHWSSSEIKLEECFLGVLKVYPSKLSPRKYEYINLHNEKLMEPTLLPIKLDFQHAERIEDKQVLEKGNWQCTLQYLENEHQLKLLITQQNSTLLNYTTFVDDYNFEYDYLMRIGDKILLLIDKQRILILN